jgi:hypothetical protein
MGIYSSKKKPEILPACFSFISLWRVAEAPTFASFQVYAFAYAAELTWDSHSLTFPELSNFQVMMT